MKVFTTKIAEEIEIRTQLLFSPRFDLCRVFSYATMRAESFDTLSVYVVIVWANTSSTLSLAIR